MEPYYSIVTHAIDVLTALIEKIREQFKRIAALPDKKDNAKSAEMPKENNSKTIANLKPQKDIIPPRPEFAMGTEKYEKLQEIYKKLVRQENAVLTCEKELELLQEELLLFTGVFQGKRRKELQGQIMRIIPSG